MGMARPELNPNSPFFHEERHAPLAPFADRPVTVCGAGALGGNLAETLARMGFARLKVVDRDGVEMRNLSTQPYSRAEVGAPKARVLANALYRAVQARVERTCACNGWRAGREDESAPTSSVSSTVSAPPT